MGLRLVCAVPSPGLMPAPSARRACVLIPTHTTRHLALCLASLRHQVTPPAAVVVTCDNDDPAIAALLDEVWPATARTLAQRTGQEPRLYHAFRPTLGQARLNQVRNNGIRTLMQAGALRDQDLLVVCDGDTMLEPLALRKHLDLAADGADVTVCYRIELTEEQTPTVSMDEVAGSREVFEKMIDRFATPEVINDLASRQRRYARALRTRELLEWTRLTKPHKPKILGGHHAVRASALRAVNGFDERFGGYRFNDDDLGRRLYAHRPRFSVRIAIDQITAVHLWHPIRAPMRLQDAPGYDLFRQPWQVRAQQGLDNPREQPQVTVRVVPGAGMSTGVGTGVGPAVAS